MKKFILIIFLTIYYLLLAISSRAQEVSLSISPPLLEVIMKPGKSIMIAYTVQNFGDPVILKAKVRPFEAAGNLGAIKISDEFLGPVRFSLDNSDIGLDQPFFLKTRDSQQLLLRMRLPEVVTEKDYYYTLLIESEPPPSLGGTTGGRAKATIGANILMTATSVGKVDVAGRITLFDTQGGLKIFGQKIFDSSAKIPVLLIIDNTGANLVKAQGEIFLKGALGTKASYEIVSQNVLAQSQRMMVATPSADFNKPASLVLSGFFLGRYDLLTNVNFIEESVPLQASTSFIAFPFKWLLAILLTVGLAFVIVKKVSKDEEN